MRSGIAVVALLTLLVAAASGAEEPKSRRAAVIVGGNKAPPGLAELRFAHRDAQSMGAVLVDVGEFRREDVHVMLDPDPAAVLEEIDAVLSALRGASGETLFLFYYSGHSDDGSLYPNGRPLSLEALRERLDGDAATIRVGIIDACRGGAWTRTKGLHPTVPFQVPVPMRLGSEGSVLLASSSGVENAHEADSLEGSFFTHHLIAGLRGAAQGPDGQVTIGGAFAYANRMTVRDTAIQAEVPQHPSFDMKLRGRQDLPLTRVAASPTLVELEQEQGPLQLVQLATGQVVLEVLAGKRTLKVAVPPGSYLVRHTGTDGTRSKEIVVTADVPVSVSEASLEVVGAPALGIKGVEGPLPGLHRHELGLALSFLPLDEFTKGASIQASYRLRFGPHISWQILRFSWTFSWATSLRDQLETDFGVAKTKLPAFPLYQLGSDVVATLFTVRLPSIASVSTSLNASLLGGIGIIGLGNTPSDMTDPMVPAFTAGASLGFAFGDFGISLDLRDHVAIARAYTWRAVDNYLDVGLSCTFGFGATP